MVAETTPLPNIRKLFLPDPGFVICDCDLAQADAQVVAWEANDEALKEIFRDPNLNMHTENAKAIFGTCTDKQYKRAKAGVHLTNYGGKARTCAGARGITIHEAERFQKTWFAAHPGIKEWHRSVEYSLATERCVRNKFGNMRYYFDRVEALLPQALAWIPQSTVALVIDRGLVALDESLPDVQVLMQVHDSIVMQFRNEVYPAILPKIKAALEVTIPYDDPLVIPTSADISRKSWGDVYPVDWDGKPVG